ncbi:MAG: hypothetical protein IPI73_02575 [Betaproteobacteria bacterium]|nr:hypothetical protein [Betaproteobacteria bacterium]
MVDATGEFYRWGGLAKHVSLANRFTEKGKFICRIRHLRNKILWAVQPSGKVQGPKLREAIYSLRIAHF